MQKHAKASKSMGKLRKFNKIGTSIMNLLWWFWGSTRTLLGMDWKSFGNVPRQYWKVMDMNWESKGKDQEGTQKVRGKYQEINWKLKGKYQKSIKKSTRKELKNYLESTWKDHGKYQESIKKVHWNYMESIRKVLLKYPKTRESCSRPYKFLF